MALFPENLVMDLTGLQRCNGERGGAVRTSEWPTGAVTLKGWAGTENRQERTKPARDAFLAKFETEVYL